MTNSSLFLSAKKSRCCTALCECRSLMGIDGWIKPAWQRKHATELWDLFATLRCCSARPCMPAALLHGIWKRHIFFLSSLEDIPYPGSEPAADTLQSPGKNRQQSNFPLQEGQKKRPHTNPTHLSLRISGPHPFEGQTKTGKLRQH